MTMFHRWALALAVLLLHRVLGVAMVSRPNGDRSGQTIILPQGRTGGVSVDEAARRVLRRECGVDRYELHRILGGEEDGGPIFIDPKDGGVVYACAVFVTASAALSPDPESGLTAQWVHHDSMSVSAAMAGASDFKSALALGVLEAVRYDAFSWPPKAITIAAAAA